SASRNNHPNTRAGGDKPPALSFGDKPMTQNNAQFPLGQIVATPSALCAIEAAGEVTYPFVARHARLDPGCLDKHDQKANEQALKDGSRIFSAYLLKDGTKIY